MTKLSIRVALCALLVMLAACGGGGKSVSSATTTSAGAVATTKPAAELPDFAGDFKRVCTTQVGFPGASSYEPTPGLHPMLFFEEFRGESWVNSAEEFPQGWTVKEDTNFKDNSDLKPVQLIACSDRVKETPTGKQCEFDDKGTKTKLELVNSTHQLTVYTATTGKVVKTETIETKTTECPYFATFQKGDTTYVETPSTDQYIAAVKSVVAPG